MTETTLADLKPDPRNARKHNPRNIGMIVDSLHQVGAARSIVIDEDNVILAGNGVIEAAAEAGIMDVRIIEASGNEIIAVKRSGLTPEQKTKLALFDNRTPELAEWNIDVLGELDLDLGDLWFDNELGEMLGGVGLPRVGLREYSVDYKPCHIDQVALGSYAACSWKRPKSDDYARFLEWKNAPSAYPERTQEMAQTLSDLIEEWSRGWRGFVITVPPSGASKCEGKEYAAGFLGKQVATNLNVDFVSVFGHENWQTQKGATHYPTTSALQVDLPVVSIRPTLPVVIVDDAITSGTTARSSLAALRGHPCWFFAWIRNSSRSR